MNQLIEINYDAEHPTVSARDLYEKIGSTERFSNWFERQLQFGFIEGEDYTGCKTFNTLARQELCDYKLTMDMAKHICMVQRNERAKVIRQNLIDLEKAWNTPEQVFARALKMADKTIQSLKNENHVLIKENERMKPKEIFADAVTSSRTSILIGDMAKLLRQNGVDIGQKRLFEWLRKKGYLIRRKGSDWNMPTQKSMDLELFEVKETAITHADGHTTVSRTTKVTGKGQQYFINKFLGGY